MEKLKPKHDHKLTDILKVAIFGLILLMPFLTLMPTALYYGFNEHADNGQPSFETEITDNTERKYTTNALSSINDFVQGNTYQMDIEARQSTFTNDNTIPIASDVRADIGYNNNFYVILTNKTGSLNTNQIRCTYIGCFDTAIYSYISLSTGDKLYTGQDDLSSSTYGINASNNIQCTMASNNTKYSYISNSYFLNITASSCYFAKYHCIFTYDYLGTNDTTYNNFLNALITKGYLHALDNKYNPCEEIDVDIEVNVNNDNSITNAMKYAWQQVWEQPLYNWTNESILKTGLDNFTDVFGINNESYITNLLTYELIIVVIYIVLDIVLTLFTWLTHLFSKDQ